MKTKLYTTSKLPALLPKLIASANDVFPGWIDSDFTNYGLTSDSSSDEKNIEIHNLTENGTFEQIFNSLNANLNSLVMTQAQVIEFAKTLKNDDEYLYFFLFKEKDDFFVARVHVEGGELKARVYRFSDDGVWCAGRRFRVVVPQLAPRTSDDTSTTLTPSHLVPLTTEHMIEQIKKAGYQVSKIM